MSKSNPGTYVMPFGKYEGESLDAIARMNTGLLYLDWLLGEVVAEAGGGPGAPGGGFYGDVASTPAGTKTQAQGESKNERPEAHGIAERKRGMARGE